VNLPNAHLAVAEQEKICRYLLNPAHPDNGGKAGFLTGLGFKVEGWQLLAAALRELVATSPVAKCMASAHGVKYIVDGRLGQRGGRKLWVRTVWIVERGAQEPRLVTAYPRQD
jgi:hypothetical protein